MTFTPNMPASGQSLGVSRPLVVGNFLSLFNTISANHYPPGDALGEGKHKFAQLVTQATPPTTVAGEASLSSELIGSQSIFVFKRESDGPQLGTTIIRRSAPANWNGFNNILDLATIVNATRPQLFGFLELHFSDGAVPEQWGGLGLVSVHNQTTTHAVILSDMGYSRTFSVNMSGTILQVRGNSGPGVRTLELSFIPYYVPFS